MTIGGTNLTEGLGFLGIGIAIVAVVALVMADSAEARNERHRMGCHSRSLRCGSSFW